MSDPTPIGDLAAAAYRHAEQAPRHTSTTMSDAQVAALLSDDRPKLTVVDGDPHLAARGRPPAVPPKYARRLADLDQTGPVKAAAAWLERVREDRSDPRGLLLVGPYGTGKSSIAGALAVEAGAPRWAQFWPVSDLLAAMRAEIGQPVDGRLSVERQTQTRRLLVLDDVGAEQQVTDWSVATLTRLIEGRYNAEQLLVVSTNLTPKQLGGYLGERTLSRLREMTELVEVVGPDRRRPGGAT